MNGACCVWCPGVQCKVLLQRLVGVEKELASVLASNPVGRVASSARECSAAVEASQKCFVKMHASILRRSGHEKLAMPGV